MGVPTASRFRRRADVLWRRSLDAVVILPAGATEVLTLAETGPDLWELLAAPASVADLAYALARRYDADPAVVESDLTPVVDHLVTVGAVEVAP